MIEISAFLVIRATLPTRRALEKWLRIIGCRFGHASIPLFDSQKKTHIHTLLLSIYYVCPNQSLITTIQLQSHISYIHFEWDKAQELMVMNTQLLFILIKQTPNIATLNSQKDPMLIGKKSKNPWLKLISFDVKNLQPIYHQCTVLSESITGWSTTPPVRCV